MRCSGSPDISLHVWTQQGTVTVGVSGLTHLDLRDMSSREVILLCKAGRCGPFVGDFAP